MSIQLGLSTAASSVQSLLYLNTSVAQAYAYSCKQRDEQLQQEQQHHRRQRAVMQQHNNHAKNYNSNNKGDIDNKNEHHVSQVNRSSSSEGYITAGSSCSTGDPTIDGGQVR